MSRRTHHDEVPAPRRRRWVAALGVLVVAGIAAGLVLGLAPHRPATAPTTPAAAPSRAPAPSISAVPVPSDPSLTTSPPAAVPATVLADAPGLPKNLPPVALGQPTSYGDGLTARLVRVTAVSAQAHRPGEISGPALAVTVEITNAGPTPASLDTVAVNLFSGPAGSPAPPVHDGQTQPLHGSLPSGSSETATYVFSVPTAQRAQVTVTVSHGAGPGSATAVFAGPVA